MKIFTVDKIRKADEYTIAHEPISSLDLMERASQKIAQWVLQHYSKKYQFLFVLGNGNNAGDGLAVARLLCEYGYKGYYFLAMGIKGSKDFEINLNKLRSCSQMIELTDEAALQQVEKSNLHTVWVDALFGSGLSRPIEGKIAELINFVNAQEGEKLAIDIPSGLFADRPTNSTTFKADFTLSLQFPKLAFMMPENEASVGEWFILPIGIHKTFLVTVESNYSYTERNEIALPVVSAFAHKGTRGRCTIIAGGYGRMGAAVLAGQAALKSGIGLLSMQVCRHCVDIIQNAIPESLLLKDENEYALGQYLEYTKQDVIAFGPAVGFANKTELLFERLLNNYKGQLILDADAISILAEHKKLCERLPVGTILTPHIGEFDRLVGEQPDHFERLKALSKFAQEYQCNVLLKGKNSVIAAPSGKLYFNSTGNNGMAKGGSGDVLTGMIAGLFPLYGDAFKALQSAVFLHGLAGDICAKQTNNIAMLPSSLIQNLHMAQNKLGERQ